jgi:hypothetical protein
MSGQQIYKLSIEAVLPDKVVEDKTFTVTYKIKNTGINVFPGGNIAVLVNLPDNVGAVSHPISVGPLQPNGTMEKSYNDMRAIAGCSTYISADDTFQANNGGTIELYLLDGRRLRKGQLFAFQRARTNEEVSQARSVKVAAYSLVILIIIQVADWFIRYYWRF